MKTYEYRQFGLENLILAERDEPRPGPHEVVVRFRAASLNYRDLLFARGGYNLNPRFPVIPLSDGAGDISAVGEGVTRWKIGDRVCPIFMQGWIEGRCTPEKANTFLGGGGLDGVLCEYGAFHENGLRRPPKTQPVSMLMVRLSHSGSGTGVCP